MSVQTHPPGVSHSFANKIGIVDDVVMRQGGTLWNPSRALETDIRSKLLYLESHKNGFIQYVKVTLFTMFTEQ